MIIDAMLNNFKICLIPNLLKRNNTDISDNAVKSNCTKHDLCNYYISTLV